MIVCDAFVFPHLHKSGGTFVGRMMMTCIASAKRVGYHLPYAEVPASYRALPVIGTVRNPWSYYVSWYHFQQGQAKPNPLFIICSEDRSQGFEGTITNLLTLENDNARVVRLAEAFPDHFVNYGLNVTRSCIRRISGSGLGFYSFLYNRLYAGAPTPRILRMEELRQNLHHALPGLPREELMKCQHFLQSSPNLNVSEHAPYHEYYTPDLAALVAKMDRNLIEAYGYRFDNPDQSRRQL
ncbi:hypothetical protein AEAC466_16795 [Asticcacaulis sp. AC466]|uniref:hypothetical protein n=1 Tax=Asticcacaulis sp. AC466 TaxID=1282362 RepID=UPI0003C3CD3F|nr:hypothetical protein [Asticcacaulis sp. AC466]ESQ82523.1 hypothetical protein AEAC466_16795 [Asticcacaulis sp. AC466]